MTKLKTHKGTAKRFVVKGSRIKHKRANKNHNFSGKNQQQKRQLRGTTSVNATDGKRVARLLRLV